MLKPDTNIPLAMLETNISLNIARAQRGVDTAVSQHLKFAKAADEAGLPEVATANRNIVKKLRMIARESHGVVYPAIQFS